MAKVTLSEERKATFQATAEDLVAKDRGSAAVGMEYDLTAEIADALNQAYELGASSRRKPPADLTPKAIWLELSKRNRGILTSIFLEDSNVRPGSGLDRPVLVKVLGDDPDNPKWSAIDVRGKPSGQKWTPVSISGLVKHGIVAPNPKRPHYLHLTRKGERLRRAYLEERATGKWGWSRMM